ncbi:ABC transporter substrate-binding protein [Pelagibacterium sp. H642]|uniref:ABC transporter substrate-binding protein n=1 Tax=Pelagibacterium sp. H642 TaxID=1881069 RepID=UPI002814DB6C|nr:ABC transporter substrate-binding protein [Pelagibacterium sp. H642]WMT90451.1 ABC transporter substrate-binding protein [Pelagibacterium sp. H642]
MKNRILLAMSTVLLSTSALSAAEIVVGAQNMATEIDPGMDHSNVGSQFYVNAFDPLIQKDYTKAEAEFSPGLATAWEQTSPTTMEVQLRQGVKFHDGSEMTAEDVVFSFERIIHDMTAGYESIHTQFFDNFEKVEAIDTYSVRFTTYQPEPLFETLLNASQGYIVPKDYILGLTGDSDTAELSDFDAFGLAPVGTGPYKITHFQPGETVTYERFEDYYGEQAPLEGFEMRRISEMATRLTALNNGEVDLITNVPPDQIATIENNPALKVEGAVTPLFHVVIFNGLNPKLEDPRIRQALSLAIDRDLLNEALWLGEAVVPSSHTFPQYGELYMPELDTYEYDPERARELLAEAGYDGTPIRYDTDAVYYTNGLLAAQAIKEMWAEVGVEMNLNVTESWGELSEIESRNWSNPMYFADPAGSFGTMWAPGGARTGNTWQPNGEYEALWNRFRYSTDIGERRAAYAEIMAYVKEEMPVIPLYQPYESYGMRADLDWRPLPGHIPYVLDFRAGSISIED